MNSICDADLHHLKPGKKVVLKSFNSSINAAENTPADENYWQLIGRKAVVSAPPEQGRVLIRFSCDFAAVGLVSHGDLANSLWVDINDLKFVCRY